MEDGSADEKEEKNEDFSPPRPLTVLIEIGILSGILFGIIFVNEINENELECELEFVNVENVNCEYNYDLFIGPLSPLIYPTPAPKPATPINFIEIDIGLCGNNIFECIFNVVCNGIGFVIGKNIIVNDINNENFCDYEYYCGDLFNGYYPTPTPQIIFIYNKTGNGLPGFNVHLCENNVINEICNGINNEMNNNNGMSFLRIFLFFSPKTLVNFVHKNLLQHDYSLFVFLKYF